MSIDDKIKAAAKNVEGKVQEAAGEITDDNTMKAEGKLKQAQAAATNFSEDIKDKAQDLIEDIKNVDIKEKTQDLVDDIKNVAGNLIDKIKNKSD